MTLFVHNDAQKWAKICAFLMFVKSLICAVLGTDNWEYHRRRKPPGDRSQQGVWMYTKKKQNGRHIQVFFCEQKNESTFNLPKYKLNWR